LQFDMKENMLMPMMSWQSEEQYKWYCFKDHCTF